MESDKSSFRHPLTLSILSSEFGTVRSPYSTRERTLNDLLADVCGRFSKKVTDPLYRTSAFILVTRLLNVVAGFFFWLVAARLYSTNAVGLATALISSVGIVVLFSRLGFDISLIRFIGEEKNRESVFNTCLAVTTLASFAVGLVIFALVPLLSTELSFVRSSEYFVLFLFFAIASSIVSITGTAFIAMRKARYYMLQSLVLASRIPLLLPLAFAGTYGIFGSVGLAFLLSSLFAFLVISGYVRLTFRMNAGFVRNTFRFSARNYVSGILFDIPALIMPLMVLNTLGDIEAGKYYIAFAIGGIVLTIPDAMSTSLLVEGSHGENLRVNFRKAALAIYALLLPSVVAFYLLGRGFLGLFGEPYLQSLDLLKLLVLSSLFAAVYSLYVPIKIIRYQMGKVIGVNAARFLLIVGLSYVLLKPYGIAGIGYAWLLTYALLSVGILFSLRRETWSDVEPSSIRIDDLR